MWLAILLLLGSSINALSGNKVKDTVSKNSTRFPTQDDTLSLLLMGDTQFHFACDVNNTQCTSLTATLRSKFRLDELLDFDIGVAANNTSLEGQESCRRLESRFANHVQRQAIDTLISSMKKKPAALIINGDLTQHGRENQLHDFKRFWYNNFSIPFLLGLGNHDYEDNFKECEHNICAHTMLSWYTEYVNNHSIAADIQRKPTEFGPEFTGSLAYTKKMCSGKLCAHVIQLNNAIDYNVTFSSFFVKWDILEPKVYLENKLIRLRNTPHPILLNMHKCEEKQISVIEDVIKNWISNVRRNSIKQSKKIPKIGAFYAHWHPSHEAKIYCIGGFKVPFVYVGSVPNNRFSLFQMTSTNATLTGYKAVDSDLNNGKVLEKLETVELWGPCTKNETFRFEYGTVTKPESTTSSSVP